MSTAATFQLFQECKCVRNRVGMKNIYLASAVLLVRNLGDRVSALTTPITFEMISFAVVKMHAVGACRGAKTSAVQSQVILTRQRVRSTHAAKSTFPRYYAATVCGCQGIRCLLLLQHSSRSQGSIPKHFQDILLPLHCIPRN